MRVRRHAKMHGRLATDSAVIPVQSYTAIVVGFEDDIFIIEKNLVKIRKVDCAAVNPHIQFFNDVVFDFDLD